MHSILTSPLTGSYKAPWRTRLPVLPTPKVFTGFHFWHQLLTAMSKRTPALTSFHSVACYSHAQSMWKCFHPSLHGLSLHHGKLPTFMWCWMSILTPLPVWSFQSCSPGNQPGPCPLTSILPQPTHPIPLPINTEDLRERGGAIIRASLCFIFSTHRMLPQANLTNCSHRDGSPQ